MQLLRSSRSIVRRLHPRTCQSPASFHKAFFSSGSVPVPSEEKSKEQQPIIVKNSELTLWEHALIPLQNKFNSLKHFIQKHELTDWPITIPIGLYCSMIAFHQGVILMDEETQYAVIFLMASGLVYKYGGASIRMHFEEESKKEFEEQRNAENLMMDSVKKLINVQKMNIGIYDDLVTIGKKKDEIAKKKAFIETRKCHYELRDTIENLLKSFSFMEKSYFNSLQSNMVEYAHTKVNHDVMNGSKNMKEQSLQLALQALAQVDLREALFADTPLEKNLYDDNNMNKDKKKVKETSKSEKSDIIVDLFAKYMKEYAEDKKSRESEKQEKVKEELKRSEDSLNDFFQRHNLNYKFTSKYDGKNIEFQQVEIA